MKGSRAFALITALLAAASAAAQEWPQWRGPNRDNRIPGFTAPAEWPKELKQSWKVTVGAGEASPVLYGRRVFAFGRIGSDEVTTCINYDTGAVIWQDKCPASAVTGPASSHPGPRATPAVASGFLCTLGVGGVVTCLAAQTGKIAWRKDTKSWPRFYTAASPLIVDGKCVVVVGGDGSGSVMAFDLLTGEEAWKAACDGPSYGSPVLAEIGGWKQVVVPTERSLIGVSVADGKLLWQTPFLAGRYNMGTPVVDGSTVYCSGRAVTVTKEGDGFVVKDLWKGDSPHQYNTPVLKDGFLYGLSARRNLFCVNAKSGETVWTDTTARGECGSVLDAGAVLLAVTSDMNLVAFKPGNAFAELASLKVAETPTWSIPIVAGKRMVVKDSDSVALYSLP